MGPAHVALAWRHVAWVSACVTSTVYDRWGPRARVARQKKGWFLIRARRIRTRGLLGADRCACHWATVRLVLDLGSLGLRGRPERNFLKTEPDSVTGLTTGRKQPGRRLLPARVRAAAGARGERKRSRGRGSPARRRLWNRRKRTMRRTTT